ncbi:MAG TPA: outer membrane beta-barrel protein [Chlorobaculum sp.]|nr:outer membrane beta-barrel protein [Chlorobaculum sp.]
MKKTLLLALLFTGLGATPALAKTYVSGSGGVAFLGNSTLEGVADTIEYYSGYDFNGAVGYNFGSFRLEGAVGYQNNRVRQFNGIPATLILSAGNDARVNFSMLSYMANAYADFNVKSSLQPYVMGGVGAVTTRWVATLRDVVSDKDLRISSDVTSFAWQVGLGVGVKLTDHLKLDFGYRYFRPSNAEILMPLLGEIGNITLPSHNLITGIRYEF